MKLSAQAKLVRSVLAVKKYELHEALAYALGKRRTARRMKARAEKARNEQA